MAKKIYVGNLPFRYGFKDLTSLFEKFGEIQEALVVADRFNGRSKGFGFITFAKDESAQKAIKEMNGKDAEGRPLQVREATPKSEEPEQPKKSFKKRD
ncbi:MAG: RNA-binding protein [Candidatus Pacearchaeota archaeon]|jgi:RNA recognition motif-containing protein